MKYASFLNSKLSNVPVLKNIVSDRVGNCKEFVADLNNPEMIEKCLLYSLQIICDFLVNEITKADKPRAHLKASSTMIHPVHDQIISIDAQTKRLSEMKKGTFKNKT